MPRPFYTWYVRARFFERSTPLELNTLSLQSWLTNTLSRNKSSCQQCCEMGAYLSGSSLDSNDPFIFNEKPTHFHRHYSQSHLTAGCRSFQGWEEKPRVRHAQPLSHVASDVARWEDVLV
jgi:hypothetical protein